MSYRVIVCGSRTWKDDIRVKVEICALVTHYGDVTVVHGDCPKGADSHARRWAADRGAKEERHPADWNKHGRGAGFIRNQEMADAGADLCLAFCNGATPGTQDMMRRAHKKGIKTKFLMPGIAWQEYRE